jgi:palmitoyltransferase
MNILPGKLTPNVPYVLCLIISATYASNPILNTCFAFSYSFCTYFYAISMAEDPGYVPKTGSLAQQKTIMDELFRLWKFDDQNFCVNCMVRMPLRSKHCRRCKRCVAKHDQ